MISIFVSLIVMGSVHAGDLAALAPNTWTPLTHTSEHLPAPADEKGGWSPQGWNKLLYDPVGKRVLFYDRYADKKHGDSIYGNCLFSLDTATGKVSPLKVDNWGRIELNGYRTVELAENAKEPTPCPRHVCGAFEYVPEQNAVFICNGANSSAMKDGQLLSHALTANMWRLDLGNNTWTQVAPDQHPTKESVDDSMAYCPDTKSIILTMKGKLWIHDLTTGKWHKAKQDAPLCNGGQTICYDPPRKRMLINGGLPATGLWAFDPKTEKVTKLADCPAEQFECSLAYDSKHDVFLMAVGVKSHEYAPGTFCYDPRKDAWKEIKTTNPTPASSNWNGWIRMCYDAEHDCFVGLVIYDQLYVFRYVPENQSAAPANGIK